LTGLYGFFDDESHVYLILELLPDGNLKQRVKDDIVSEQVAANIIYQVCSGVSHMHGHNIIHRDIKPENMFIFDVIL
jgi:serine/threonine protein kinase